MKRPWLAAAGTAALTSLLFLVIYNLCNYITAMRPDVGVWVFEWERHWPLIPAMIIPYWSIDALFVVAPFVCATREELVTYRRRMVFAIAAAGICFLAIPLQFAFPRPQVDGAFSLWFKVLHGLDQPHNLFPSLHITFRTLLTAMFLRAVGVPMNWAVHIWFSLIGISTLLTWQHHLVDVVGGFWLAAIAIHLYRFDEPSTPHGANVRVAVLYGLAAWFCSQIARLSWPWTFPFVWPAFALGVAAFAYSGRGPAPYRKRAGKLTKMTEILFGPLLFGQWLSWHYYRRSTPGFSKITPQVWIGAHPTAEEVRAAAAEGVTDILDLTLEFSAPAEAAKLRYHSVSVLDLTAPTPEQLTRAVAIIEEASADGIILVHCKAGYSRSAGVVGAWLLSTGRCSSVDEAISVLRHARPAIVIRPEIRRALENFAAEGLASSEFSLLRS